jgi:hypothetical protein
MVTERELIILRLHAILTEEKAVLQPYKNPSTTIVLQTSTKALSLIRSRA